MKFTVLFQAARNNFPQAEYRGTFLDYDQLESALALARIPPGTRVSFRDLEAESGEELFFTVLKREVATVASHFDRIAGSIITAWRAHLAGEDIFEPTSDAKLGHAARYCWQFGKLNAAALHRLAEDHDRAVQNTKGHQFVEALMHGPVSERCSFLVSPLFDELTAITKLGGDEMTHMELFDSSITGNWAPNIAPPSHCPECRAWLLHPVGLKCSHVICKDCINKMIKSAMQPTHTGVAGLGLSVNANRRHDFSTCGCPVCDTPGIVDGALDMKALGLWVAKQQKIQARLHPEQHAAAVVSSPTRNHGMLGKTINKNAEASMGLFQGI